MITPIVFILGFFAFLVIAVASAIVLMTIRNHPYILWATPLGIILAITAKKGIELIESSKEEEKSIAK